MTPPRAASGPAAGTPPARVRSSSGAGETRHPTSAGPVRGGTSLVGLGPAEDVDPPITVDVPQSAWVPAEGRRTHPITSTVRLLPAAVARWLTLSSSSGCRLLHRRTEVGEPRSASRFGDRDLRREPPTLEAPGDRRAISRGPPSSDPGGSAREPTSFRCPWPCVRSWSCPLVAAIRPCSARRRPAGRAPGGSAPVLRAGTARWVASRRPWSASRRPSRRRGPVRPVASGPFLVLAVDRVAAHGQESGAKGPGARARPVVVGRPALQVPRVTAAGRLRPGRDGRRNGRDPAERGSARTWCRRRPFPDAARRGSGTVVRNSSQRRYPATRATGARGVTSATRAHPRHLAAAMRTAGLTMTAVSGAHFSLSSPSCSHSRRPCASAAGRGSKRLAMAAIVRVVHTSPSVLRAG
jgi:hypothetical protein